MTNRVIMVLLTTGLALVLAFSGAAFAESKPFAGVTVKFLADTAESNVVFEVNKDYLEQKLGVKFQVMPEPGLTHYVLCMRDWMKGGGNYDLVSLMTKWNADFMGKGYLMRLDDYLAEDPEALAFYNNAAEGFRKLFCEWGGHVYGYPQDPDATILFYRKDLLLDATHRLNFKTTYGYELPVPPQTIQEMLDVAEFFTHRDWNNNGKDDEYGLVCKQWVSGLSCPTFLTFYMTYTNGQLAWDKDFHPDINNESGVKTLELMKEMLDYMPPGFLGLQWLDTVKLQMPAEEKTALALHFGDAGRWILNSHSLAGEGGIECKDKMGYASWPGVRRDGELVQYNEVSEGRIFGIPRFADHPDAAFAVVKEMRRPERMEIEFARLDCGTDAGFYSCLEEDFWGINVDTAFVKAYLDAYDHACPVPLVLGSDQYYQAFEQEFHKFANGDQTATQTLANIEDRWEKATDRLGRDFQKTTWEVYTDTLVELGFKVQRPE